MKSLGVFFLAILLVIYSVFSWGYLAAIFYYWFVLPFFPEFPVFTYQQFIGFMFFISVMTHKGSVNIKDEYRDKTLDTIQLLIGPWVMLFVGWLVKILFF
jgi:hypothetical protein